MNYERSSKFHYKVIVTNLNFSNTIKTNSRFWTNMLFQLHALLELCKLPLRFHVAFTCSFTEFVMLLLLAVSLNLRCIHIVELKIGCPNNSVVCMYLQFWIFTGIYIYTHTHIQTKKILWKKKKKNVQIKVFLLLH